MIVLGVMAGVAHSAPTLELVGADGIEASTGYLKPLPKSLEAGQKLVGEAAKCGKLVAIDYKRPSSALVDIYLTVGADGKVASVDTETDPSTHVKHKNISPAAGCVAPLVKAWTLPDHEIVILRFVVAGVPVKKATKLPASYVTSLAAVCAAAPKDPKADVNERVKLIGDALGKHPDSGVQDLLGSMGGFVNATRPGIIKAMTANAGIAACPALLDIPSG